MNKYFIEFMNKIKSNVIIMKNLADIKKEFGIKTKQDIIDIFGLDANISTKEANRFLKDQYKLVVSEIKKQDRLFRAREKRAQLKKVKKLKDKITEFKQNKVDNLDFEKLNVNEMKALLQSLQNATGRILFTAGNRTFTLNPNKINELLSRIDDLFMETVEAQSIDEEYIISSIVW